ncbi:MAG: hypothetical protein JSS62_02010 [Verrucomicrobia bacterium]|nr:hypothetical protein [Verrucomicrobiota bacterium]MBS0645593.1 hypothetical protein [Verrucomicrobiota bacterium]
MSRFYPLFSCGRASFSPSTAPAPSEPSDSLSAIAHRAIRQNMDALQTGAAWIGREVVMYPISQAKIYFHQGTHWLGHKITWMSVATYHHVIKPVKDGLEDIADYTRLHYRAILAHLFAWGLILVCYGSLYGFRSVTLPMLIGMGPGCLGGMLLGALVAKTFHQPTRGNDTASSLVNRLKHHIDAIPTWTSTLLIAVAATIHLNICCTIPIAGGIFSGAFFGGVVIYQGLRHKAYSSSAPLLSTEVRSTTGTSVMEQLRQRAEELQTQLTQLQEQIRQSQQRTA